MLYFSFSCGGLLEQITICILDLDLVLVFMLDVPADMTYVQGGPERPNKGTRANLLYHLNQDWFMDYLSLKMYDIK